MKTTVALALLVATSSVLLGQQPMQSKRPAFNPRTLARAFRPIVDAPMRPGSEVGDDVVADSELVLGVVVEGKARAYPINQLTGPSREIINDKVGGKAIAATW